MNKWISVKDRLPEYKEPYDVVLVCDANDVYGSINYAIAWRDYPIKGGNIWCFSEDLWEDRFVTHWMPLPELPEADE